MISERVAINKGCDNKGKNRRRRFGSQTVGCRIGPNGCGRRNQASGTTELNGKYNKGTSPRCPIKEKRTKETSPSWPVTARQTIEKDVKQRTRKRVHTRGDGIDKVSTKGTRQNKGGDVRLRKRRGGADIG